MANSVNAFARPTALVPTTRSLSVLKRDAASVVLALAQRLATIDYSNLIPSAQQREAFNYSVPSFAPDA